MASEEVVKILGGQQNVQRSGRTSAAPVARRTFGAKKGLVRKGAVPARAEAVKERVSMYEPIRLKTRAVTSLSQRLEYPKDQLFSILNVSERTAQRREEQGVLNEDESDRLYRIARVTERAERVFGSEAKAHAWLKSGNQALRGVTPLSLLGTDAGAEVVTDELVRIEHGDLF